jgi:long-subunit fatty acid transport protein
MMTGIGAGTLGLLAALGAPRLAAQSWALPASDPVGIARSGAGVAFGNSLEAGSLNPALLATLRDRGGIFLAVGQELQASNATLQSNQQILYSSDRNRFLPAMGAAWRIGPDMVLGFKIDEPFLKHAKMPLAYVGRFQGQALDLNTHRMEAQLGWAASPNWAFGASLGATRIQYSWDNMIRSVVLNPSAAAHNAPLGLMESDLHQEGNAVAPSYSMGFRWAPNSRWTLGGSYVGIIKTSLPLSASYGSMPPQFYTLSGGMPAPTGTSGAGLTQMATTQLRAGDGSIALPGKATLGVRQRVNQVFTWELDVRYVLGSQARLPGAPSAVVKGQGAVSSPAEDNQFKNGMGMSLMGELTITKRWVVRLGASLDPALRSDTDVNPLVGGAKTAGFSGGFGYKALGGEWNFGYQYRQTEGVDTGKLDGAWPSSGYTSDGSSTRVQGMGHLWSFGYKRMF